MNKLLCSTIWFVVLRIARRMVSFTAMLVIDHYVNNAETNIRKVPKTKTMKLSPTDTANKSFEICQDPPTRNLDIFRRECKTSICSKCSTMKEQKGHEFDDLMTSKISMKRNMPFGKVNFLKSKNIFYQHQTT